MHSIHKSVRDFVDYFFRLPKFLSLAGIGRTPTKNEIIWCYRTLLGREPESESAMLTHANSKSVKDLVECFVRSPEYLARMKPRAVSTEEIRWCYRTLLGREPESEASIVMHLHIKSLKELIEKFVRMPEFQAMMSYAKSPSPEEISWCYRTLLGREPESETALRSHANSKNLKALIESFTGTPEFQTRITAPIDPHDPFLPLGLPKNEIEYEASAAQLEECLVKIKTAWSHMGITEPHFSVKTANEFRQENLNDNLDKFWASGESEVFGVELILARHGFASLSTKTGVEYGCGVGRVTMGLARRFAHVHGYDISPGHMALAEQRAHEVGVVNCKFHLCAGNILEKLEACDFFYSKIVFQHNPPPVIHQLIRNAFRSLKPDGIAIFQVPTYLIGYRYSLHEWLRTDHGLGMQMHCLPQRVIFSIIAEENCDLLEVREDNSTGAHDQIISNVFVVQKRGR